MKIFKIELEREWTEYDRLVRYVRADTEEEAQAKAEELCPEYDKCCPDDTTSTKSGTAGDWGVDEVEDVTGSDDLVACANCDWVGEVTDVEPIRDIDQRVAPGETMPAGECPECGALCHLMEEADAEA